MQLSTTAIHVGQEPDLTTGAIIPPLYLTSTYAQTSPGVHKGYEYTRSGNPNFTNVEKTLAALENGQYAHIYSSGLGATTTIILSLLNPGDQVLAINDLYGGTYRLLDKVFARYGIWFAVADLNEKSFRKDLFASSPKMLWIESPTNPLLKTVDLQNIIAEAKEYNIIVVVDNTFATPYHQQPLDLGADIVLHSTTKYLWWHSDIIGGATITNNPTFAEALGYHRNAVGINPSPFDAWMLSRSLKTFSLRMRQHHENARYLADRLSYHPLVSHVYYPRISGIISVEFAVELEIAKQIVSSFKLFTLAESLGGVESLVDHPASMTHASIPREVRLVNGLSDGLMRFSVGIEDKEDLRNDLEETLTDFIK